MKTKEMKKLTAIGKYDFFQQTIKKLTLNEKLSRAEETFILSSAIIFLREYEKDKNILSYADLAYYLILKYSLNTLDYKPLYDFSINFGFYPISKIILKNRLLSNEALEDFLIESKIEDFKHEEGHIETLSQYNARKSFISDFSFEKSYIAPTSFGKSSVILEYIRSFNKYTELKIVIVVPTKSLLMQTYKMIQRAGLSSKLIIHDDMYSNQDSFIAIFTQERALRLLKKGVSFDVIIIDEAHKLFDRERGILISRLIKKNGLLNFDQKIIYLSPLVENTENLKITQGQNISNHHIKFNLKEPEFFEFKKLSGKTYKYNRFVNQFYETTSTNKISLFEYFKLNSGSKNFLFENSPQKIEDLAKEFCESGTIGKTGADAGISDLKKILSEKVHEDYFAIEYVDYGLVYIHAQLPDLVKEYLEYKFKTLDSIRYIIANTVISEGMNLPIDTLFICGSHNISNGKALLNLIGRVNRLDKIFAEYQVGNLPKLLPKVHLINEKDNEHDSRFKYLRSRVFEDVIKNPTLEAYDIKKDGPSGSDKEKRDKFVDRIEKIQKYEKFIYSATLAERDDVKKYFIENGLNNYYDDTEAAISSFLKQKNSTSSTEIEKWKDFSMMQKVVYIFMENKDNVDDLELKRLSSESTQKYYEGYFKAAIKLGLRANIDWQVKKFKEIISNEDVPLKQKAVYIGESYGDMTWSSEEWGDSKRKVYVNLLGKTDKELINIAIVKLQIEENFVSFTLNKFIRALYDFQLITESEYHIYTYGTDDVEKIKLHRQGMNLNLITRLMDAGQLKNISTDDHNNLNGNDEFKKFLATLDDFYQFEIRRYIGGV